jgi:hypothetical protein
MTRDVTIMLTQRIYKWVSVPVFNPPVVPHEPLTVGDVASSTLALADVLARPVTSANALTVNATQTISDVLAAMRFDVDVVSVPNALADFAVGDRIIRIVGEAGGKQVQVFDTPQAASGTGNAVGPLVETLTLKEANKRPGFSVVGNLGAGSTTIVNKGGGVGPILDGHWTTIEIPVPVTALTNGAETSILIFSKNGAALGPGLYTLHVVFDRDRWKASTEADPEQHYHDEQTITLQW